MPILFIAASFMPNPACLAALVCSKSHEKAKPNPTLACDPAFSMSFILTFISNVKTLYQPSPACYFTKLIFYSI